MALMWFLTMNISIDNKKKNIIILNFCFFLSVLSMKNDFRKGGILMATKIWIFMNKNLKINKKMTFNFKMFCLRILIVFHNKRPKGNQLFFCFSIVRICEINHFTCDEHQKEEKTGNNQQNIWFMTKCSLNFLSLTYLNNFFAL